MTLHLYGSEISEMNNIPSTIGIQMMCMLVGMWIQLEKDGSEAALDNVTFNGVLLETQESVRKIREMRAGGIKICVDA